MNSVIKAKVYWYGDPKATEVAGRVAENIKMPVQPITEPSHDGRPYNELFVECKHLHEAVMVAAHLGETMSALFKLKAKALVNNKTLVGIAYRESIRSAFLALKQEEAIEAVKRTRSWLRDSRVADIRFLLENSLEEVKKGEATTEMIQLISRR